MTITRLLAVCAVLACSAAPLARQPQGGLAAPVRQATASPAPLARAQLEQKVDELLRRT